MMHVSSICVYWEGAMGLVYIDSVLSDGLMNNLC